MQSIKSVPSRCYALAASLPRTQAVNDSFERILGWWAHFASMLTAWPTIIHKCVYYLKFVCCCTIKQMCGRMYAEIAISWSLNISLVIILHHITAIWYNAINEMLLALTYMCVSMRVWVCVVENVEIKFIIEFSTWLHFVIYFILLPSPSSSSFSTLLCNLRALPPLYFIHTYRLIHLFVAFYFYAFVVVVENTFDAHFDN